MPFEFEKMPMENVVLIKPKIFPDERGFFMETYKKEDFEKAGILGEFVQDNHTKSAYGVLRGLHFQEEPFGQAKLFRCIKGQIFDVCVDLRKVSPTFGKHISLILSEDNKHILYVPRGFAHGFISLTEGVEVLYKTDALYNLHAESGIIWNDPDLNIRWPIDEPVLSGRDKKWPTFKEWVRKK